MTLRPAHALAVVACLSLLACSAEAQTWQYKSYKKNGMGGNYSRENFVVGSLTLAETDGRATVRLVAGAMDACLRGDVPAEVTRSEAQTVIELKSPLAGCEPVRYVIRNDGSGGSREHRRGDRWVDDSFDHGLTLVKP